MRSTPFLLIVLAGLFAASATPTDGQSPHNAPNAVADSSFLRGEVVEARTDDPLPHALVTAKALVEDSAENRGMPARTTLTDAYGRYAFEGLPPGLYELEVARVGYRAAHVRVEIRRTGGARVAIGLELEPIVLEPLSVAGEGRAPYDRDGFTSDAGVGEVAATELRQRQYLASDVWSLTHAELMRAVTLAESDILRALHRLPGVSTRDDWTAELWLRGSAWDHTRVYFDGLPLFNPLHGGGIFSGVNSDAVGAVYLHPGVRPARLGEGVSALEITSRPAGGTGDVRGFGELSLASARVAVDRRSHGGQGGWMLAARRTYLDWLSGGLGRLLDVDDAAVPYRFTDLTARLDKPLAGARSLEMSLLWEADLVDGDIADVVHGSRMAWGNLGAQTTLTTRHGTVTARHSLGFTGYNVDVDSVPSSTQDLDAETIGEIHHKVRYMVIRSELSPASPGGSWRAGYDAVHQSLSAGGEVPPMYRGYRTTADEFIDIHQALTSLAVWLDRRWTMPDVEFDAGLRVEGSSRVRNGGAVRLAPRVLARVRPVDRLTFTLGAGRSHQYTQMLVPIGFFRPEFPSGHMWLLAGDEVPALRADVATLGGELWVDSAWLVSTTGYVRAADGIAIPDPRPGITAGRPLFVVVQERGRGVEAAIRRLKGRTTASLAYTLASTEQRFEELAFPSDSDRRHVVDATLITSATPRLRIGAAFTFATGAPFTRVTDLGEDDDGRKIGALGAPNEGRAAAYSSLDVALDWTRTFRTWGMAFFIQVRNVLGNRNHGVYEQTVPYCASELYEGSGPSVTCGPDGSQPVARDRFLTGMPRVPLLGIRVQF